MREGSGAGETEGQEGDGARKDLRAGGGQARVPVAQGVLAQRRHGGGAGQEHERLEACVRGRAAAQDRDGRGRGGPGENVAQDARGHVGLGLLLRAAEGGGSDPARDAGARRAPRRGQRPEHDPVLQQALRPAHALREERAEEAGEAGQGAPRLPGGEGADPPEEDGAELGPGLGDYARRRGREASPAANGHLDRRRRGGRGAHLPAGRARRVQVRHERLHERH
mmetsp:Transcript_81558/g.212768  ORF Transcript_81558/g.212768 Transcript_81558/m.212768 type:complete len:224 (+) Transcript_81558:695-1366(+)